MSSSEWHECLGDSRVDGRLVIFLSELDLRDTESAGTKSRPAESHPEVNAARRCCRFSASSRYKPVTNRRVGAGLAGLGPYPPLAGDRAEPSNRLFARAAHHNVRPLPRMADLSYDERLTSDTAAF